MQEDVHVFKGMGKDNHPIKQDSTILWEGHNIRLTARDSNSNLSITTEQSTQPRFVFSGHIYKGHCIVGNFLILFTYNDNNTASYILRVKLDEISNPSLETVEVLYREDDNPPEKSFLKDVDSVTAISDYESDIILKVYWVDGENRPRVINVYVPYNTYYECPGLPDSTEKGYSQYYVKYAPFDSVPDLDLNETVSISRSTDSVGSFPSGVILYAFTYLTKYGAESNIFYTSELLYCAHPDRGGSPEERIPCAFTIRIEGIQTVTIYKREEGVLVSELIPKFDYIRVYSILRTSLDGEPTVRLVKEVNLEGYNSSSEISITDTNTEGEIVDPSYLLYRNNQDISASTIYAKDGTLFLGGIKYNRPNINSSITPTGDIGSTTKEVGLVLNSNNLTVASSTFKSRESYRLGVLFLYKTGEWTEPIDLGIKSMDRFPSIDSNDRIKLPIFSGRLLCDYDLLIQDGYVKVRTLIAKPLLKDRSRLFLGIVCPTVYKRENRDYWRYKAPGEDEWDYTSEYSAIPSGSSDIEKINGMGYPYALSSWLLRPNPSNTQGVNSCGVPAYKDNLRLGYSKDSAAEILCSDHRKLVNKVSIGNLPEDYLVSRKVLTLYSPDIEFFTDEASYVDDTLDFRAIDIGYVPFDYNYGSINIETSSPTINTASRGLLHLSTQTNGNNSILSPALYEDSIVTDSTVDGLNPLTKYDEYYKNYDLEGNSPSSIEVKYKIYLWQRNGSLNNDCVRPENTGIRSAVIKKKVIANKKVSWSTVYNSTESNLNAFNSLFNIFNSDNLDIIKIAQSDNGSVYMGNVDLMIIPSRYYNFYFEERSFPNPSGEGDPTITDNVQDMASERGIGKYNEWLKRCKDSVRIRYKTVPHIVFRTLTKLSESTENGPKLLLVELARTLSNPYGDNKESILWIPSSKAVSVESCSEVEDSNKVINLRWEWGDTWFLRYNCLKTYPFSQDDENLVIEIGSFLCETRTNLGGIYDRNLNLEDNTNVSPVNFNKINYVYSLLNTFFNYRILDEDYYKVSKYPSQIMYTNTKVPGATHDEWTNLHLASSIDLDSSYGAVTAIRSFNERLFAFQERGILEILFNSRVQIAASDGIPIEIANNQKVTGTRIFNSTIGCQDEASIVTTPKGIYFVDNNNNSAYILTGDGATMLSKPLNNEWWFRDNHSDYSWKFIPENNVNLNGIRLSYDPKYGDIYFTPGADRDTCRPALCYSEDLALFTSLIDYGGAVMFPYNSHFFSLANNTNGNLTLWENFAGTDYGNIFGEPREFSISFISNDKPTLTKIFDTIELRADNYLCEELTGEYDLHKNHTGQPFNYIRVLNEYLDTGIVELNSNNLRKKFRIWRGIIPRNLNTRERIRNPWSLITLGNNSKDSSCTILHDLTVKYTL